MKVEELCRKYNIPEKVSAVLEESGILDLYPPQIEAVEKGVLDGKNIVLAIPTAAGKTLIAEFSMLRSIFNEGGKCLYIVPLRAMASEKFDDFRGKYGSLGVKVGISTGDFDIVDPGLARYDVIIATSEKVDSLLRHRAKWLADVISVVVLDEVHLIDDPGRGPTLEVLTARLQQVKPNLQVLALSATVKNADEIAKWLKAELVRSEWRPVPLKKGVYYNKRITFGDGSKRKLDVLHKDDLTSLAIGTVQEGGQALVFVNTRRSTQTAASLVAKGVGEILTTEEKEKLVAVAKIIESALGESTRTCRELAGCVKMGAAFHHAGLHHTQRKNIEVAFKKNLIKVICATPTLAMGVNLPSRRTIIRDYRRYVEPYGLVLIPVFEFHQMAGRAGRPQYDEYGEAVVIAKGRAELDALFDRFIAAEPERITSKLATEPALRTHVLASIAASYVNNQKGLLDFMERTFFSYQYGISDVKRVVQNVLDFLSKERMIRCERDLLLATPFGERVSMLYIDPLSAVIIRDGIQGVAAKAPTALALLHLVCHTPNMGLLYLRQGDYSNLELTYLEHRDELLTPIPDPSFEPEKYEALLAELKTSEMLQFWINESREVDIQEMFSVGAGDIRRLADTAKWLIYSSYEIARLFKAKPALTPLRNLQDRIRYGIREELLGLVQLRGIGRVRGRSLYSSGYRNLANIKQASEQELARVPYMGAEIASSIKLQIEHKPEPDRF